MPLKEQYHRLRCFRFHDVTVVRGIPGCSASRLRDLGMSTGRCARYDHVHERQVLFSPSQSEPFDWFERELVPPK
jgi:hypothetical protein